MSECAELASRLAQALGPGTAPVAITFNEATDGDRPQVPVAAGCQFWEWGAERRVTTTATDHAACSIGVHTHNLADAPATQADELGADERDQADEGVGPGSPLCRVTHGRSQ